MVIVTSSEYEGPLVMVTHSDEVNFQFGVRMSNGMVVRLNRDVVRAPLNTLVRRRVVPIEDWKEVAQDELA